MLTPPIQGTSETRPNIGASSLPGVTKNFRTQRIKALVADDDAVTKRRLVRSLTAIWPGLVIIEADDGIDAWDRFLEHEPQFCFLDVRMPGLTGIEVACRIGDRAQIVFLSAANDRALSALEAGSVMHLVKPLDANHVAKVVARVQAAMAPHHRPLLSPLRKLLDSLTGQMRRPAPLEAIETGKSPSTEWLMVEDVVYFEADANGTRVVSKYGEAVVRTPLKELAARLDTRRFTQINRFAVVNQQHIQDARRIDEDTMVLSLREQPKTLAVSRHFQAQFDNGLAGLGKA